MEPLGTPESTGSAFMMKPKALSLQPELERRKHPES